MKGNSEVEDKASDSKRRIENIGTYSLQKNVGLTLG